MLTPTLGTTAGFGQFFPRPEQKPAVLTGRRLKNKSLLFIPPDGFHDMDEMVFYLPLRNAEQLRQLVRG